MKPSQIAIAGGVFAAVLVGCFAVLGVGPKAENPPKSAALSPGPVATAEPPLPAPKPPSAALGGFGQVARLERGYDATAALTRTSTSSTATLATWAIPEADVREFGDAYRSIVMSGDRFAAVSDLGIRVLDARTGEPAGHGFPVAKDFPNTALSPHGDWAVQPTRSGLSLIDTVSGAVTKLPATAKRSFHGPAGFGRENNWCAVLGDEAGKPTVFRVRKSGTVEVIGDYRPDTDRGDASRIGRVLGSTDDGRFVFERPAERSPTPRLLAWVPTRSSLTPLPPFDDQTHDAARQFRLSPDGKRCLMFDSQTLKAFDLESGRLLATVAPENVKIGDAAFAPEVGRVVIAYTSQRIEGDVENTGREYEYLPGHVWVLDLTTKASVGWKLQLADLGVGLSFRRLVMSADGARLAVVSTDGKVRLVDTHRAFGAGVLTAGVAPLPPEKKVNPDY